MTNTKEARAEYMRAYRAKNKDKIKAYQQAWEDIHKIDRRLTKKVADKTWRTKNKEELKAKQRTPERRFATSKYDAKRRGIEFNLTFEQWHTEVQKTCHYCRDLLGKRSETTVGLDRLDNTKGYVAGNVVSACIACNKIKLDIFTSEETAVMVNALLAFRQKNK